MPEICRFNGITIHFFYDDHNPPHFHVCHGSKKAVFEIETLEMTEGSLPKKYALLVVQWAFLHRAELLKCWEQAKKGQEPSKIKPLRN
jgi:hypothetical protein